MKLSYSWLNEYLQEKLTVEEMSEILTSVGLEVEDILEEEVVRGGLEGVLIGKVLECEKHENADRLKVTRVDLGNGVTEQIVCGAPNVAIGQTVVVATVGTSLFPKGSDGFKIKKAKIRGVESSGMICAEDELGLGESHDGIIVLDEEIAPGTPAKEYYNLPDKKTIFEIGLTPNRMDAMSHLGAAKDISAYLANKKKYPVSRKIPEVNLPDKEGDLDIEIEIRDTERCPRYMGICLSEVKVGESPEWLKEKLIAIGSRPINNVVDITNFVLHECGQPLHAFDYDKISGKKVIVQVATEGEKFVTLDEVERILSPEDLMICDAEKPLVIAGVFGGLESGVTDDTRNIFIESAMFQPVSIRRSALRHNLRTDASQRFEKGVDISGLEYAMKRAAQLICEICGAKVASEVKDVYPAVRQKRELNFSGARLNTFIGREYSAEQIKTILTSLEFEVTETSGDFMVKVPFAKPDIEFMADIAEEILRIDGLNQVEFSGRINYSVQGAEERTTRHIKEEIAEKLVAKGFYEINTNSITHSAFYAERTDLVTMINNLSSELDVMRPSMLEPALQSIVHNVNRKNENLLFFEFGKIYTQQKGTYKEKEMLALFVCGNVYENHWKQGTLPADYFYLKGILENVFASLQLQIKHEMIYVFGQPIGLLKEVDESFGLKKKIFYAELDWDFLADKLKSRKVRFTELPKFPGMERDLSLVLDRNIMYESVSGSVRKNASSLLQKISLFDVFENEKLGKDKKSYAIRLQFLDREKTLTDKMIDDEMSRIISGLQREVQAEIRS